MTPEHALPLWQVDAFTDEPFAGNSAAVCLMDGFPDSDWMQQLAMEMNLSETAFVVPGDTPQSFHLRWFTPKVEVDLCGHATLATAHILFEQKRISTEQSVRFETRSGTLSCESHNGMIRMDFPATPPKEVVDPTLQQKLESLLNARACYIGRSREDILVVLDDPAKVFDLEPDFDALAKIETRGLIVSACSDQTSEDFISRFFAPRFGINEDPVTGSAHCCLAPYWSAKLGRQCLVGRQVSRRSGVVHTQMQSDSSGDDRVLLSGNATTVFAAQLSALPKSP